ncbi:uncharacterized protein LOC118112649 [Hippoglossus stenolepis]|uniref:uncharacterized protein LOC118112649 n=1 Tax=Hippoglossus stenolepis TaxID=195615 RepID=UPI001FAF3863|nr:uncharacterized protein LOC118112649 [Hippoglossus stenolepis]
MASILGETSLSGIVSEKEGDTDMAEISDNTESMGAVGGEDAPGLEVPREEAAAERHPVLGNSASRAHGSSGHAAHRERQLVQLIV